MLPDYEIDEELLIKMINEEEPKIGAKLLEKLLGKSKSEKISPECLECLIY